MTVQFHGERDDLITYADFSNQLKVTQGNLNLTTEKDKWLSFTLDDKELLVSKANIRNDITWSYLYSRGLVYGSDDDGLYPTRTPTNQLRIITLEGKTYKVRLLKGLSKNYNSTLCYGLVEYYRTISNGYHLYDHSEWARLFYPLVISDDNLSFYTGPKLAAYIIIELDLGLFSWCQERHVTDTTFRVLRGNDSPSRLYWSASSLVGTNRGWRACLERM